MKSGRKSVGRFAEKIRSHGHETAVSLRAYYRELLLISVVKESREENRDVEVCEDRTYPGGEADVIDETENVGRAQVQHGQQGLEKQEKRVFN